MWLMKTIILRFNRLLLATALLATPSLAWTKVEFDSEQLRMKNAEQMAELVKKKIKKAQDIQSKQEVDDDEGIVAEPDAIEELQDAMRIVLSRPDQDGARETTFARLRRELSDLNSFDTVISELVTEGIEGVKNSDSPAREQATYIVLLENLLAEVRPEVKSNSTIKKLVEKIRDANLEVSEKVKRQQRMRSMSKPSSPSLTAASILPKGKK